jgi:hypothetical protein
LIAILIGGFFMRTLKIFFRTLFHVGTIVRLFPGKLLEAFKQNRQQAVLNVAEAERLDRIRNPSKYLGK